MDVSKSTFFLVLFFLGCLSCQTSDRSFSNSETLELSFPPTVLHTVELNGDEHVDVLAAGASSLVALLGDGNGHFTPGPIFTVGIKIKEVAIGNLDGDDLLDVVATGFYTNDVKIFEVNTDGTITEIQTLEVGAQPGDVAVTDFNGDGKADLIFVDPGSDKLLLLRGGSAGVFDDAVEMNCSSEPSEVEIADVNADGFLDLVVLSQKDASLFVCLQGKDGMVSQNGSRRTSESKHLRLLDLDNDGQIEAVLTNNGQLFVTVVMAFGELTESEFTLERLYGSEEGVCSARYADLVITDLDADGDLDFAAPTGTCGDVVLLYSEKDGTLGAISAERYIDIGENSTSLTAADFDEDGYIDLAVGEESSKSLYVLLNKR